MRMFSKSSLKIDKPEYLELFFNVKWSFLGAFFSKAALFLTWIFVARYLGSELFGQFGIIRSTVLMFTSFAGFSLGITANKFIAEYNNKNPEKNKNIISLSLFIGFISGLIVSIVFYFSSNWLAVNTLNAPNMAPFLSISSLILLFSSLNGAQIGILQGFSKYKLIAKINFIQAAICCPLMVVGTIYFGIWGSIITFLFFSIFISILSFFALIYILNEKNIKIDFKNAFSESSLIFTYMLPTVLSGFMVVPVRWYVNSLLVFNSGFKEMGIFTATLTVHNIVILMSNTLSSPFITIMSKYKDSKSDIDLFNILINWLLGFSLTFPFIIFPEIGLFLFGESFNSLQFNHTFVLVLIFTNILLFKQGLSRIIIVNNLQWWSFLSNTLWALSLIFIYKNFSDLNALNLANSLLLAYILNVIIMLPFFYYKKILPNGLINNIYFYFIWILFFSSSFVSLLVTSLLTKIFLFFLIFILVLINFFKICLKK